MEKQDVIAALSALAHETRLDVFRLLVRAGPDGMAAGAVRVYLGHEAFGGPAAPKALARHATLFAASIPVLPLLAVKTSYSPDRSRSNL